VVEISVVCNVIEWTSHRLSENDTNYILKVVVRSKLSLIVLAKSKTIPIRSYSIACIVHVINILGHYVTKCCVDSYVSYRNINITNLYVN